MHGDSCPNSMAATSSSQNRLAADLKAAEVVTVSKVLFLDTKGVVVGGHSGGSSKGSGSHGGSHSRGQNSHGGSNIAGAIVGSAVAGGLSGVGGKGVHETIDGARNGNPSGVAHGIDRLTNHGRGHAGLTRGGSHGGSRGGGLAGRIAGAATAGGIAGGLSSNLGRLTNGAKGGKLPDVAKGVHGLSRGSSHGSSRGGLGEN